MKKINKFFGTTLLSISGSFALPALASAASKCNDSTKEGLQKCLKDNPIVKDLNTVVGFLSALVGVVVIGSLIYAGIQYIIAGDNASEVTAAKQRIIKSLVALVAYISIFSFLQWIIPGGIF